MDIKFGILLDGTRWSAAAASAGEVQLGQSGLLSLLETRLGLRGPAVSNASRIAAYKDRIHKLDTPDRWFHGSFQADEWSTAARLLSWRDELILAGWNGASSSDAPPRIKTLSELESLSPAIPLGYCDRLRTVIGRLSAAADPGITSIALLEPASSLPPSWRQIISLLESSGTLVREISRPRQSQLSCLGNITAVLDGETADIREPADADDSLVYLQTASEWEAARIIAAFLAANSADNRDVAIICSAGSAALDKELRKAGLPTIGVEEPSKWRSCLQVLPYLVALCWKPVDVTVLNEFLALDYSPVPRELARRLRHALSREPGVGGDLWCKALIDSKPELEALHGAEYARSEIASIDRFLSAERFSPDEGIPAEKLIERCEWLLQAWHRLKTRPGMLEDAINLVSEFIAILRSGETITRVLVERSLDAVVAGGARSRAVVGEVSPWVVVDHPGKLVEPARIVIWWGFGDTRIPVPGYWSAEERRSLKGVALEDPVLSREREISAWKNAGRMATEKLLLVGVSKQAEGQQLHHPYWDEIRSAFQKVYPDSSPEASMVRTAPADQSQSTWDLLGRMVDLQLVQEMPSPAVAGILELPSPVKAEPANVSYSQMEALISCPARWVFQYHCKLESPSVDNIPSGNQLIGNLFHRIAHIVLKDGKCDPAEAGRKAIELYDDLVPKLAAELLLNENSLEFKRCRALIGSALTTLSAFIKEHNLKVVSSESWHHREFEAVTFRGIIDLLLATPSGETLVVDLKWTSSESHYREEVEEGEALQLTFYAWLLQAPNAHTGYFLLSQNRLLSSSPLLGEERIQSAKSLKDLWIQAVKAWRYQLGLLREGKLEATGIVNQAYAQANGWSADRVDKESRGEAAQKGRLYRNPPCQICNFAGVCGLAGSN